MTAAAPELPREPGWYRPVKGGWEHVPDGEAEVLIAAGDIGLVHVDTGHEEVPLW
jgi:hypothetical protein